MFRQKKEKNSDKTKKKHYNLIMNFNLLFKWNFASFLSTDGAISVFQTNKRHFYSLLPFYTVNTEMSLQKVLSISKNKTKPRFSNILLQENDDCEQNLKNNHFASWNDIATVNINLYNHAWLQLKKLSHCLQYLPNANNIHTLLFHGHNSIQFEHFHWPAFKHCKKLKRLVFSNFFGGISKDAFDLIVQILHNNEALEVLDLDFNSNSYRYAAISPKSTVFQRFVQQTCKLKQLTISGFDLSQFNELLQGLQTSQTLEYWNILYTQMLEISGDDGLRLAFRDFIQHNRSLKILALNGGPEKLESFNFLQHASSSLQALYLENMAIDAKICFNEVLKLNVNRNLTTLSVSGSFLEQEGFTVLIDALSQNNTLTTLYASRNFDWAKPRDLSILTTFFQRNQTLVNFHFDSNINNSEFVEIYKGLLGNHKLKVITLKHTLISQNCLQKAAQYLKECKNTTLKEIHYTLTNQGQTKIFYFD
jgi:hypothetical protein